MFLMPWQQINMKRSIESLAIPRKLGLSIGEEMKEYGATYS